MKNMISPSWLDPWLLLGLGVFSLMLFMPSIAHAAGAGGTMPWDKGLTTIVQDLTGPFAYAMVMLGLLVLGIMLVMVHDWSRFAQGIVCVIIAGSLMVGGATVAQAMNITGALV